ncbi:Tyrosine-protein kinase wzc [Photobacterium damselae subsp. piscicida]|uniref:Polysaccharide biosynthesis tyrosine autokinase n=1 Tax=Photobacterium damsela subsp. piscicida TaxID=38294 RepID=A0A5F0Z038_PHODP|nr:polysaccharide biosynthesis tyrosine autokinase [Photobacterium damselae]MBE8127293.1 polysaccharide biosynthesis tyrosine autokinase [Photobacterium damselae subsp. piscicida]QOD54845.1 polysaccharide biosynthesis tyrosine autokinase [Photobacterium damselae subsp. piscicida]QOD58197.1 polysaccharide biosynthesis tyrosine autokinase [Photobacterium damselae subsp. piscicida]BAX55496.1 Tyrosine-protein kinase wzc [Photobacterium damselae subsp. piscicida]
MSNNPEIIDLRKLVGILADSKKTILATTIAAAIGGTSYAMLLTPIYQADSLIQVEEKLSGMPSLGDMTEMFEQEGCSATEIELLKSRMVLGETVDQLELTTVVTPDYIPVVGKGIARLTGETNFANVSLFDAPVSNYKLEVTSPSTYDLYMDGIEGKILSGEVGTLAETENGQISIMVADMLSTNVNSFTVSKITRRAAINKLKASLSVKELGKQTGMLSLLLTGEDKDQIQNVLASISENYVGQNIARNSQEAKNSLEFLEVHLPEVKEKLTVAENKLHKFRQKNESVDLGLEAKSTLDVLVGIEKELNELTFKESEISQRFTKSHPSYVALLEKRTTLLEERDRFNNQVQKLPKTQREILRLQRDVEVNQQIYVAMLNQIQELSVVQASTVGNVRIVDESDPVDDAIKPKKSLIVLASLLFGALFGSGIGLTRSIMNRGIRTPDELNSVGIPVYATIPLSKEQQALSKTGGLLAMQNPADLTIEAIRSLRTSLHFAMMEAKNNVIMITGASPEIGKSFVSANLAQVLAANGKKVLIIDCDMRKGTLHKYFKLDNTFGLSDMLSNVDFDLEEMGNMIDGYEGLDVVTSGTIPPNPSELLMHPRFEQYLKINSADYDYIILDTPPILAVTDPAIVGAHAGTVMMVGRFEQTNIKEVEIAKERFEQNGVSIKGFILNRVEQKASGYYGYKYESK